MQQPALPHPPALPDTRIPSASQSAEPLKLEGLSKQEWQSIVVKSEAPGQIEIEVHGQVTRQIQKAALAAVPETARAETERTSSPKHIAEQGIAPCARSACGRTVRVPPVRSLWKASYCHSIKRASP